MYIYVCLGRLFLSLSGSEISAFIRLNFGIASLSTSCELHEPGVCSLASIAQFSFLQSVQMRTGKWQFG